VAAGAGQLTEPMHVKLWQAALHDVWRHVANALLSVSPAACALAQAAAHVAY
jgi:hypothetical protein